MTNSTASNTIANVTRNFTTSDSEKALLSLLTSMHYAGDLITLNQLLIDFDLVSFMTTNTIDRNLLFPISQIITLAQEVLKITDRVRNATSAEELDNDNFNTRNDINTILRAINPISVLEISDIRTRLARMEGKITTTTWDLIELNSLLILSCLKDALRNAEATYYNLQK